MRHIRRILDAQCRNLRAWTTLRALVATPARAILLGHRPQLSTSMFWARDTRQILVGILVGTGVAFTARYYMRFKSSTAAQHNAKDFDSWREPIYRKHSFEIFPEIFVRLGRLRPCDICHKRF